MYKPRACASFSANGSFSGGGVNLNWLSWHHGHVHRPCDGQRTRFPPALLAHPGRAVSGGGLQTGVDRAAVAASAQPVGLHADRDVRVGQVETEFVARRSGGGRAPVMPTKPVEVDAAAEASVGAERRARPGLVAKCGA